MADGVKTYKIVINGVNESINAVDSLNKQLDALEQRINNLQNKALNIGSKAGGGVNSSKELSTQEEIDKKILSLEKRLAEVRDENYKKLLHMKEELKEYTQIAKSTVAAEANEQGLFDTNTMFGMKSQLKSIKAEMQTLDVSSDRFKRLTQQANELNNKLKEIEQGYGQYGRNVGNYANSMKEGFDKIKVAVGDTTREYGSYREAIKSLKQERFQLSQSLGQEAKEFKDVDIAVKQLESDYNDLNKSSKLMDNMLDTMQGFTAIAGLGVGLSGLFGIDDSSFNDAMKKLTSLLLVIKSMETLSLQMQKKEGWIGKFLGYGSGKIDNWLDGIYKKVLKLKLLGTWDNKGKRGRFIIDEDDFKETYVLKELNKHFDILPNKLKIATRVMNGFGKAIKFVAGAIKAISFTAILFFLPEILTYLGDLIKSLDYTKVKADQATQSINALTRSLQQRRDALGASYLKGEIKDEEYLNQLYQKETETLYEQIKALKLRAEASSKQSKWYNPLTWFNQGKSNIEFTGEGVSSGGTKIRSGQGWLITPPDVQLVVKSVQELEEEWKKCNEAVLEGRDYYDKWGKSAIQGVQSWFTTAKETQEVMRGLGNVRLGGIISEFQQINQDFQNHPKDADKYAAALARLRKEMNNSDVLNSVIANLDKYIPDEEVRTAVQNIINEIYRLDDAFNMTSEQQIHYWNQVRIDGMKDGWAKTKAQIEENRRHEVAENGKTQEQIDLINKKYKQQRDSELDKLNKERASKAKDGRKKLIDAENELIALRIENMKDGLEKIIAQLNNERRLAIQKAKENGVKVGEITIEINKKYDKKILDEKRKWAFDVLKVYEDLAQRIEQFNRSTFQKETENAKGNVSNRAANNKMDTGYLMINPSTYENSAALEQYYRKVIEIEKKAADTLNQIEKDRLERELDYDKAEEELRYKRLIDVNNGEYIQQLRAGVLTQEQYDELLEKEKYAHNSRMNALDKEYAAKLEEVTRQNLEDVQDLYSNFYSNIINDVERDKSKIDKIMSMQPVVDKYGWGIVNMGKTNSNYEKALEDYDNLKTKIINKQEELRNDLRAHRISPEDFAMRQRELDSEIEAIDEAVREVMLSQKELVGLFMQSIQMYAQEVGRTIQGVLDAVADYQDYKFDKEQEALEKENDMIQDKLDEQEDIIEKHKDKVESIEDELSTARGDRRQHLIDQLNEEMRAQRAAQREKERLDKEKEKNEKRQEELDKKRKKAEYDRNLMNIIISTAMATANGLATQPFVPVGIAMGALATSLGMVQYALAKKQKPYARGGQLDGGVAVGARHRDGGIPVLGGMASIEGGEFITNRVATAKNIDLLNFVNSKKKRVDLDDLVEFYSGKKMKTTFRSLSPTNKFAEGGQIPVLRSDIDINNRILDAIDNYAERPVVVSVVDINNKQESLKNVKVLAGLSE